MKFADSSRVGGEREVCTNRCVIVGYLWAICGQRGRREGEEEEEGEGEGEGKGEGKGKGGGGGEQGGGVGGEGTVGIRGQFMFSFLRLGKLQSPFCDFWEKIEIKMCVCLYYFLLSVHVHIPRALITYLLYIYKYCAYVPVKEMTS